MSKKKNNQELDVNTFYNQEILPEDIKELPKDILNPHLQELVERVENGETLSKNEYKDLRKVLKRYRPAIKKYEPVETVKSYKRFEENLTTERELLRILDYDNGGTTLHMRLPVYGEEYKDLYFKILPLNDSRALRFSENHIDLFKDLKPNQRRIYEKNARGEAISKEESDILKSINEKIVNSRIEQKADIINELLAYQVTPPDFNGDISKRKDFWENSFPFNAKVSLFLQVEKILGLTDEFNEKLFPDS
jgi:hypothetical protein